MRKINIDWNEFLMQKDYCELELYDAMNEAYKINNDLFMSIKAMLQSFRNGDTQWFNIEKARALSIYEKEKKTTSQI